MSDPDLLVASHTGRWSDVEALRGSIANGLCLCLMHDKAFESGYFTLDRALRVCTNPRLASTNTWIEQNIAPFEYFDIRKGITLPTVEALTYHWERIGFTPDEPS